jgi:serine protease Do
MVMKNQLFQQSKKTYIGLAIIFFLVFWLSQNAVAKKGIPDSFAELAEKQAHVAVNISTTKTIKGMSRFSPFQGREFRDFFGDEFFRHFFGQRPEEEMKQRSLGSGVVVSNDGYILTNNHVVADADEILVTLSDKKQYEAKVIGKDTKTDLALIKIKVEDNIPAATLGDSDKLSIGDWVMAIGNPFGLGSTVTAGIVSAKGRVIGAGPYDDFIQTDATINPGNSGGPLFNLEGEVIGINTAIVSQSGGNVGIGFAIPINIAKSIMPQLKERGKVIRGWLGVIIQSITPEFKEKFDLETMEGALIGEVTKGSPADKAGLKRGDIIVRFDGKKVEEMKTLPAMVAETPVGKTVKVIVIRNKKEKELMVTLGELKEEERMAATIPEVEEGFGFSVQELTPELAESLSLNGEKGVVVSSVKKDSPASDAGLQRGDLIQEIEHKPIETIDDYKETMQEVSSKKQILIVVKHRGHSRYVVLKREEK